MPDAPDEADDPVRFDFGREEARVVVRWAGGSAVHMVWPGDDSDREDPFFYLEHDGLARTSAAIRELYGRTSIIPVITPLDRGEDVKDEKYVRRKAATRLASRHFRNHALLMRRNDQWESFREFCRPWLPEIELLDVKLDAGANRLGVFYSEPGSRIPKELAWAGDGIQIWVQLLWHLAQAQGSNTIVLDEPEVYLHPDLQRRLVRLLDRLSAQIILASHSSDVIAEAPPDGVVWLDRRAGKAQRARSAKTLAALSASLGTSYNLALARTSRARLVVATDCDDPRVLRMLASQLGANSLASEHAVTLIRLQDTARWSTTEGIGQVLRDVLPPGLPAVALLQTGSQSTVLKEDLAKGFAAPEICVKFWRANQLENYLLSSELIARTSGAAPETVALRLAEICETLFDATKASFIAAHLQHSAGMDARTVLEQAESAFEKAWTDPADRLKLVPGIEVLRHLNLWLESDGYRPVSAYTLAKAIKPQELDAEIFEVIMDLEDRLQ
jgi:hypothetical protein